MKNNIQLFFFVKNANMVEYIHVTGLGYYLGCVALTCPLRIIPLSAICLSVQATHCIICKSMYLAGFSMVETRISILNFPAKSAEGQISEVGIAA